MKFLYTVIGLILILQSIYSAPVDVEEIADPEFRGFFDSLLTVVSPFLSALTNTGQSAIDQGSLLVSSAINGMTSYGGNLLNNAQGAINSFIPSKSTHPVTTQNDEELLDFINALVNGDQAGVTVDEIPSVSQDEIVELVDNVPTNISSGDEENPLYVVLDEVLDDYLLK